MYENWEELEASIKNCQKCKLCQARHNIVFGEGNKQAKIMFIGEGPGADEDTQGLPFVGKAGQLMNKAFQGLGIKREDVYITNIVKCRPPANRVPEDDEAVACLDYLRNQVVLIKPKIIVLLGSTALKNILGKEYGITSSRGNWIEQKGILYMPTWHPAALLRDENKKVEFWKDLKEVAEKYNKLEWDVENERRNEKKVEYCLNCKNPGCRIGCPLSNHIPDFIAQVKEENYEKAYEILCETTVLPAICGRICPHQKQCQGKCIRGIKGEPVSIGELEAFVGDLALKNENALKGNFIKQGMPLQTKGKKVAVIGGGPAGLTAAAFLRKYGFHVTIYEKQKDLGGILKRGIPEFRLNKEIVDKTISQILSLGIEVQYNKEFGKNLNLTDLEEKYDAIFLSIGANIPRKMVIPGEETEGVFGGNTLLEKGNHPDYHGKKVAIIGGGNVAMDCARTIKRLGAEQVVVIYRRSEMEMPAEVKEIADAKKEGVEFLFLTNITKVLGENKVEQIECIKTKLVQKEGETRMSPVDIENSNFVIPMDYVVMAVGGKADKEMLENQGFEMTKNKYVQVNEYNQTSHSKVFAGGDVAGQVATVAWAARDGREVAQKIAEYLR